MRSCNIVCRREEVMTAGTPPTSKKGRSYVEVDGVWRCEHVDERRAREGKPGVKKGWGWIYRFGPIQLITCTNDGCFPDEKGWINSLEIG